MSLALADERDRAFADEHVRSGRIEVARGGRRRSLAVILG